MSVVNFGRSTPGVSPPMINT